MFQAQNVQILSRIESKFIKSVLQLFQRKFKLVICPNKVYNTYCNKIINNIYNILDIHFILKLIIHYYYKM